MYVRSVSGLGALSACPADLTSAPTAQILFDRIRAAVACELRLAFASSTDPGLFLRRQRLKALFRAVPGSLASSLQRELEDAATDFAKLFWHRLHPATARELLGLLCQAFFKEYELRFNPVADTFSVDNNPLMKPAEKTLRKGDVNGLIGDAINSPGLLWKRLLARADAALEAPPAVPGALPAPTAADRAAVTRLSDAQLALFRESFPDGSAGGIDFASFQSCFERFANGELRDSSLPGHVGFGEPNGGNYFLFAEFAFLCVDLTVDESVWGRALKAFVKTQEIFMHVYREGAASPPPVVGSPLPSGAEQRDILPIDPAGKPGFDFRHFTPIGGSTTAGRGQSDFDRKMRLRARYDGMNVAALKAAARDNLARAIRMR